MPIRLLAAIMLFFHISFALEVVPAPKEETLQEEPVKAVQAIPLTKISEEASNASIQLDALREKLSPDQELIDQLGIDLPTFQEELLAKYQDPRYEYLDEQSIRALQKLKQKHDVISLKLNKWKDDLDTAGKNFESAFEQVDQLEKRWKITRESLSQEQLPEEIITRIDTTEAEIATFKKEKKERYKSLLVHADTISQEILKVAEINKKIDDIETKHQSRVFVQENENYVEVLRHEALDLDLYVDELGSAWAEMAKDFRLFFLTNRDSLIIHVVFGIMLLGIIAYLFWLKRQQRLVFPLDDPAYKAIAFIDRPVASYLLLFLAATLVFYPERPQIVGELLVLLSIPALALIMPTVLHGSLHRYIYAVFVLYGAGVLYRSTGDFEMINRSLLLALGVAYLFMLYRVQHKKSPFRQMELTGVRFYLLKLVPVMMLIVLFAVFANLFGVVSLAERIILGLTMSLILMVVFYLLARIISGLLVLFIRRRTSQVLHVVKTYAKQMESNVRFAVNFVAFLMWGYYTLKSFAIWHFIKLWWSEAVSYGWTFGTVVITIEELYSFVGVLIVTWLISRLVQMMLDLEVFPRIRLPRGVPTAISMVLRYFIIGLGFFLALSSLGVDMGHLGLLAGALGVGLGFGLRNIIANFVSGIIMVFERPVQIGDTIEIDTTYGEVKSIGVRSSEVKTFDGSEVIVPNADFISKTVTNWTLSDKRRRAELDFKVAFGSDPKKVLELMHEVALDHEQVLNDPEPMATFKGFGEYFLEFKLYYWVSDEIIKTKSEIALNVYEAVKNAGIHMPVPVHDVRMEQGKS
jgi:small-conductance mechanosensitive channel